MNYEQGPVSQTTYLLAVLPVADCILNQINTAFHVTLGPLSLLQAVRLPLLVLLLAICIRRLLEKPVHLPLVIWLTPLMLLMFVVKEYLATGAVAFSSVGSYGQLLYWVVFWAAILLECRTRRQADLLLAGMAAGALLSAASILIGFDVGGLNPYADDGVNASAGWFNTAKTVTGVLLTGACILLYRGRTSRSWAYPLLSSLCFLACIVTYARAGQVAAVLLWLWLALWCLLKRPSISGQTAKRFVLLTTVIAVAALPIVLHSGSFTTRWQDVGDRDKGGSGRAAFWPVAVEEFQNAEPSEKLLGFGYSQMATMLYKDYGADIRHTHSDVLDTMLLGGICGMTWWVLLVCSLLRPIAPLLRSYEGMAGGGILLAFLCQGQLTGQLLGTDAMTAYVLGIACLGIRGALQSESPIPVMTRETETNLEPGTTRALPAVWHRSSF